MPRRELVVTLDDIHLYASHVEGSPFHTSSALYARRLSEAERADVIVVRSDGQVYEVIDRRAEARIQAGMRRLEQRLATGQIRGRNPRRRPMNRYLILIPLALLGGCGPCEVFDPQRPNNCSQAPTPAPTQMEQQPQCAQHSDCPSLICDSDHRCLSSESVSYVSSTCNDTEGLGIGTLDKPYCDLSRALLQGTRIGRWQRQIVVLRSLDLSFGALDTSYASSGSTLEIYGRPQGAEWGMTFARLGGNTGIDGVTMKARPGAPGEGALDLILDRVEISDADRAVLCQGTAKRPATLRLSHSRIKRTRATFSASYCDLQVDPSSSIEP